jgi:hypothetical protein
METLSLPEELIIKIIDNPTLLSDPPSINISAEQASSILGHGYIKGFRTVFILNANLSAAATVTSIVMIKHKNLTRDDEERLKREAKGIAAGDEEKGELVHRAAEGPEERGEEGRRKISPGGE